jgi:hypothetical protein
METLSPHLTKIISQYLNHRYPYEIELTEKTKFIIQNDYVFKKPPVFYRYKIVRYKVHEFNYYWRIDLTFD